MAFKEGIQRGKRTNNWPLPNGRTKWWTRAEWMAIEIAYLVAGEYGAAMTPEEAKKHAAKRWVSDGASYRIWPGELAFLQGSLDAAGKLGRMSRAEMRSLSKS